MQSPGLAWMLLEDRKQMVKQKVQPNLEGPGNEIKKNDTFGQPGEYGNTQDQSLTTTAKLLAIGRHSRRLK